MPSVLRRRDLLVWSAAAFASPALAQQGSTGVVRAFSAQLVSIGALGGVRERFARFLPLVQRSFDIATMVRIAVGSYWPQVAEGDRGRIQLEFARFVAANYASRISDTAGLRIEVAPTEVERGGQRLIRSEIIEASGRRNVVSYAVRGGRIVDIYLDGDISEIASRRAEFGGVLASSGAAGLLALLRQRTERILGS